MADLIPGGAFPEAAEHETRAIKRPDGKNVTAFAARAKALKAMRDAAIDHEKRLAALEAQPGTQPTRFP